MRDLLSYRSTYYALCKINRQLKTAGYCLLLHSQSTVSVKAIVAKEGDLQGYVTVWYHPDGIANTLSLENVLKKHKVTYDSSQKTGFVDHKEDGTDCVFIPSERAILLWC